MPEKPLQAKLKPLSLRPMQEVKEAQRKEEAAGHDHDVDLFLKGSVRWPVRQALRFIAVCGCLSPFNFEGGTTPHPETSRP